MGCILPILSVFMPRVVMVFIFLLTHWFSRAFDSTLWPLLGFLFMPYTTLVWMAAMLRSNHRLGVFWLILLVVAVFFDLGGQGRSFRRRKREHA
jgi:hypothetical protein